MLPLLWCLPLELRRILQNHQRPTILQVDATGHLPVAATAGHGMDSASIQRCDDVVNAVVDALHSTVDRHGHLISKRPFPARRVAMPAGSIIYRGHLGI